MNIEIHPDRQVMGARAASQASLLIRSAIKERGRARPIAATGASQSDFLEALTADPTIDWTRVTIFHLKVTPMVPASTLQTHADTRVYLDKDSASLLRTRPEA